MKYLRHLIIIVFLLFLAGAWVRRNPQELSVRIFCAYDKLFIEFEEKNSKWGTMFLDEHGRPMSCKKKSIVERYSL
jgi:hypothetical protein